MPRITKILPLCLALAALLPANPASAQLNSRTAVQRDFLNYGQYNPYQNYAFEPFSPFPVFGWDAPSYDRLGRYLMQGRVMLSADEDRPGLSRMQGLRFETGNVYAVGLDFNYTVLQDSYQGRSYAMMVMLGSDRVETAPIKTRFSPLTLNMTRYTGVRFDVNGPKNKASFIYSRGAGDRDRFSIFTTGQDEQSPVILWGTHWETQIGAVLRLGSTFVNQHLTDATASKGSIFRGNLANGMRPPDLIVVRVVDDSPQESAIPAAAYAVDVVVRGRDEAGNDQTITNAQELATGGVQWVASMDPGRPSGRTVDDHWEAAGEAEMIEFTFVMPAGFQSSQAQFVARVGGDYRLQVRQEHTHEFTRTIAGRTTVQTKKMQWPGLPRSNPAESAGFEGDGGDLKYPLDFKFPEAQPAYTVVRSAGASGSLEAREVRFDYGFPTAQTLASLDLHLDYAGLKVNGEFAFNVQNFKFPFADGRRNSKEVRAYYLTAQRRLPLLGARAPRLGFEVYRLPADFSGNYDSRRGGAIFHTDVPVAPPNTALTQEFNLFDDNDDGDQWPDDMPDDTPLAGQNDAGVFPGLDENKDNVPDTDQNANGVPDWDEPFLFFWSDPPAFIYDVDMNNNGLPDQTENDDAPDYPYSRDQRGYHGLVDLSGWASHFDKLSLGAYRSEEIAGGGKSRVDYLRWEVHYQPKPWGQFALLGDLKRVEDSIADPVYVWKNATDPRINSIVIQEREGQYKLLDLRDPDPDPMSMRKSTAGTFYLAADLQAADHLSLRGRYKWNLNRQHEAEFADRTAQGDRTLSRLTLSHRIEYRRPFRKALTFTARARHLYWQDAGYAPEFRQHWSTYGLLFEEEFKLTERTALVAGQEGVPGLLPVYHNEHHAPDNDFRRWTDVLMLRTQSTYLGWSTVTEMGFEYQRKESKTSEVSNRTFFVEMVFGF